MPNGPSVLSEVVANVRTPSPIGFSFTRDAKEESRVLGYSQWRSCKNKQAILHIFASCKHCIHFHFARETYHFNRQIKNDHSSIVK